jgi:putative ABC transport system permease protein
MLGVSNPDAVIGQIVRIGMQFEIIGVLRFKGARAGFGSADDQFFIPFGTGRYRLFKTDRIDDLFALATTDAELTDAMNEITQAFTSLLAGIASVGLLVGGIGMMNIMLVSVTERTREIGIRKALGATRPNILLQFLIEAVTLCILAGCVGVGVGVSGAVLLRNSFGWSTGINVGSVVLAFAFAADTSSAPCDTLSRFDRNRLLPAPNRLRRRRTIRGPARAIRPLWTIGAPHDGASSFRSSSRLSTTCGP